MATLYDTLTNLGIPLGDAQDLQDEFGNQDVAAWVAGMRTAAQLMREPGVQLPLLPTAEPWSEVCQALAAAPATAIPYQVAGKVFDDLWPGVAFALDTALHACYLRTQPRATVATPAAVRIPDLPPEAAFSPTPPPMWLTQYVELADCASPMTPRSFHESAGLWLLSATIARRLVLQMHYGPVYPNLYVCWVAGTTLYRKTTALRTARDLLYKYMSDLVLPSEMTPESLLGDLAGREPTGFDKMDPISQDRWRARRHYAAQRGWVIDEISGFLASAGRDYNQGLLESVLRLYDCDDEYTRSTRSQGHVTIRAAYVSLLGATTPMAVGSQLTEPRLWSMGWWPRFAILTPEASPIWRDPRDAPSGLQLDVESGLQSLLSKMQRPTWPDPPVPIGVAIDADAHQAWAAYNQALAYTLLRPPSEVDERLHGAYGRLPTSALKIAMLFAALEWRPSVAPPRITLDLLSAALVITERWRASAHRALDQAAAVAGNQLWERIITHLARYQPDGATLRELYVNHMRDQDPDRIESALRQLVQAGEVEVYNWKPAGRGRPARRFRLAVSAQP